MAVSDPLIALDAMGGDNAPREIVLGAVTAARDLGLRVALVGRREEIIAQVSRHGKMPETMTIVEPRAAPVATPIR